MNVTFYNFTKRRNSTKIPTGAGTVKDCKLKDNCSVHDPVILLASSMTGSCTLQLSFSLQSLTVPVPVGILVEFRLFVKL